MSNTGIADWRDGRGVREQQAIRANKPGVGALDEYVGELHASDDGPAWVIVPVLWHGGVESFPGAVECAFPVPALKLAAPGVKQARVNGGSCVDAERVRYRFLPFWAICARNVSQQSTRLVSFLKRYIGRSPRGGVLSFALLRFILAVQNTPLRTFTRNC